MSSPTHLAIFVGHSPVMAKLCQFVLSRAGEFELFETAGRGAMALLGHHHFDIALLEFTATGLDLIAEIRASPSNGDVPIIVIMYGTTEDYQRYRPMCLAAGANAVVTAPYRARELVDAIVALVPPR